MACKSQKFPLIVCNFFSLWTLELIRLYYSNTNLVPYNVAIQSNDHTHSCKRTTCFLAVDSINITLSFHMYICTTDLGSFHCGTQQYTVVITFFIKTIQAMHIQCNTEVRSCNIFWVCVHNICYTAWNMHASYCHLWPVLLYHVFPHYLTNGIIFGKKLFNIKSVFWFSVQILSETLLILKRTKRGMIT